jgi:hypothetical protein
MVDAAHPLAYARGPGHAVVERAGTKARDNGKGEDCRGRSRAATIRAEDQQRSKRERNDERCLVQNTAQPRPDEVGYVYGSGEAETSEPSSSSVTSPGSRSLGSALRSAAAACFFSCFRTRFSRTRRSRSIFANVCCRFEPIRQFYGVPRPGG